MKIFNLFQTDIWKTKNSRVFFGCFSSKENAKKAAANLKLFSYSSNFVILEMELDKCYESGV